MPPSWVLHRIVKARLAHRTAPPSGRHAPTAPEYRTAPRLPHGPAPYRAHAGRARRRRYTPQCNASPSRGASPSTRRSRSASRAQPFGLIRPPCLAGAPHRRAGARLYGVGPRGAVRTAPPQVSADGCRVGLCGAGPVVAHACARRCRAAACAHARVHCVFVCGLAGRSARSGGRCGAGCCRSRAQSS